MRIKINELLKYCEPSDYIILCDKTMRVIAQGSKWENFFIQEKHKHRYTVEYTRKMQNGQNTIIAHRI